MTRFIGIQCMARQADSWSVLTHKWFSCSVPPAVSMPKMEASADRPSQALLGQHDAVSQ